MNSLLLTSLVLGTVIASTIVAKKSLEKLDTDIQPFYEFNLSLKQAGVWSVVFYVVIISILAIISLILSGINFGLVPA